MPSYMYILECADGSYYTGSTWNLEKRLWQHQNGEGANYTKKRLPVKLVYCEPYDRVEDAFRREKQVQGWSRRKKKVLIEGNSEKLIELSRNYTEYGKGGDVALIDPASTDPASTSSAYDSTTESATESASATTTTATPASTNEPLREPVEGSGGATGGSEPPQCTNSRKFGEGRSC